MKYRDGYVLVSVPGKGVVWQGRTAKPANVVCEPFEETFAQAGDDWIVDDMPDAIGIVRMRGVPFIADTLRDVWLWVAGGEQCAIAPIAFGLVRGLAMKSRDGRIAVIAQCEEPRQ